MRSIDYLCRGMSVFSVTVGPVLFGASVPAAGQDFFSGQSIFQSECARCHGVDGRPVVPGTPDFTRGETLARPDAVLAQLIKHGGQLMPAYNGIIPDRRILDVIAYIRTLQR
jgi:cytochrome c6